MGKAKRKINRLRRKFLKKKISLRIPVAPPGFTMSSSKDYNRKTSKQEVEKMLDDD